MKIGILITARLGSTRLQKKHLLPVNHRPLLHYLVKRIGHEFQAEMEADQVQVIIATSDEPENRAFEFFCPDGLAVFYGSTNNIPLRHLQTAQTHSLDAIVSIDGDDILCSVKGMRAVYQGLLQGIPYVHTTQLPFGMNSMGYTQDFLASSLQGHTNDVLETGWGHIFDNQQLQDRAIVFPVQNTALRFTLDYPEDYKFFSAVIESFGDAIYTVGDEAIVDAVIKKKLFLINEPIAKQYWDNFYKLQKQEKNKSAV